MLEGAHGDVLESAEKCRRGCGEDLAQEIRDDALSREGRRRALPRLEYVTTINSSANWLEIKAAQRRLFENPGISESNMGSPSYTLFFFFFFFKE
jgi:hypothetical protein